MTIVKDASSLQNCTPIGFTPGHMGSLVQWVNLGAADFVEPFFSQTIENHLKQPGKSPETEVFTSSLEALCQLPGHAQCIAPTAFIFHSSRCGSTLLANALKSREENLVLAEPEPLNYLLSSPLRMDEPEIWRLLFSAIAAALSQPRRPRQKRYFIKFSSHAILQLPLIQQVFPSVPWLFLYRHPLEILVSALENPPDWMDLYNDPAYAQLIMGLSPDELSALSLEGFVVEILRRYFTAAIKALGESQGRCFCLSYDQLTPDAVPKIFAALEGRLKGNPALETDARDTKEGLQFAKGVFARHSKNSGRNLFQSDSAEKQAAAGPALKSLFHQHLEVPYETLERLRLTL